MGHGWTSVDCDFFLPPLEAPPFIFMIEDNKDPAALHQSAAFDHKKQSKSAGDFLLFAPTALSPRDAFGTTSIGPKFVDFEEL